MFGIINKEYEEIIPPIIPLKRAVTVMDYEMAKRAFHYIPSLQFLICLNEKNMRFKYCFSVGECYEFFRQMEMDYHHDLHF